MVNQMIKERNNILDEFKENLTKAQERTRKYADKKRRELQFQVRDLVHLKMQPYRFCLLASGSIKNLSPRCYAPYKVIKRIGPVAYRLSLHSTAKIHSIFHVL